MGKNKTSDMHDALVAIAITTVIMPSTSRESEAIAIRGD
jgi:hypothetical protein